MLKDLRIRGFKSIRNGYLEFGRVNLFIGGNGAGKSNVLEALGVLSAGLKDISDIELQKRGVRLSVPTLFKSAFRNTDLRSTLSLSANFEGGAKYGLSIKAGLSVEGLRFFSESIKFNNTLFMGRSPNGITVRGVNAAKKDIDPTRGLWDRFRETVALPPLLEEEMERMARYAIYAPQTAFLRGTDVESTLVQPLGLQGGNLAQAAQAVLQYSRDPSVLPQARALIQSVIAITSEPGWSRSFRIRNFDPETTTRLVKTGTASLYFVDRFMKEGRNVLSAYDSSEGTLYLLFIAVLLLHPRAPKILALDNVDNALNPSITKKMIEVLINVVCSKEFRRHRIGPDQVFMTSHNPTSLDAMDIFDSDQRIFVVKRDAQGATVITPLKAPDGSTRADWIEKAGGKQLSELWIEGHIAGALGI